jgi:hypothetical protein
MHISPRRTLFLFLSVILAISTVAAVRRPPKTNVSNVQVGVPTTQLFLNSEPGEYIGGGRDYSYGPADGVFSFKTFDETHDGLVDKVEIDFVGPDGHWSLVFATNRLGQNLAVGIYNQSQSAAFTPAGVPGLSVDGLGHGCDAYVGRFAILDAQFDYSGPSPTIVRFAAEFEQHCEDNIAGLTGSVYVNSAPSVGLTLNKTQIQPSGKARGIVTLPAPATAEGAQVFLASVDSSAISVPESVTIPEGSTTAEFKIKSTGSEGPRAVPILATYNGVATYATVNVVPAGTPQTLLTLRYLADPVTGFGGQSVTYTQADGSFDLMGQSFRADGQIDSMDVFFRGNAPGVFQSLGFATKELGVPLAPGTYRMAERWPFESAGHPGVDANSCTNFDGSFVVLSASYDYTFAPAKVVNFAATLKINCNGNVSPTDLRGTLYFNYSPPN